MLFLYFTLILGTAGARQEDLIKQQFSRQLLQTDQELQLLCIISSNLKGAFVLSNEQLVREKCSQGCADIEPINNNNNNSCKQVTQNNLCDDPDIVSGNYCAKSCNRCNAGVCKRTKSGCKCLDKWTYGNDPQTYDGCANPDGDVKGSWCKIDPKTCEAAPSGKNIDHCDPQCQSLDTSNSRVEAGCEEFGAECQNKCGGEKNIKEIICNGVREEKQECICVNPTISQNSSLPKTTKGDAIIVGDCYDFMPSKEGKCSQRVAWGSCSEAWMTEKFYCAISCNLCDQPLSKQYDCLPDFQNCLNSCGNQENIQEFACFRQLKKSECACQNELQVKSASSSFLDIVGDGSDCIDYLPADEGTCEDRLDWGSCKEQWMRDKNYCAKTCGFCQTSGNTSKGDHYAQLSADLARSSSVSVPIGLQSAVVQKNPTNTFQQAKILQVLTFQDDDDNTAAPSTKTTTTTHNIQQQFVDAHNNIRKAHCTRELVWSPQLAQKAEGQTQKCSETDINSSIQGKNVYITKTKKKGISIKDVVQSWYQQASNIDYNNLPSNNNYYDSLYQLLWQQTSSVGCSMTECASSGNTIVLCLYNPAANNDWKNVFININAPC